MADRNPIPLTPVEIQTAEAGYATLLAWVYPPESAYVTRMLQDIIPGREKYGRCRTWVYVEPAGQVVGFGTLHMSDDWRAYCGELPHPYIPLLSVNPGIKSLGYGETILNHLVAEAATLVRTTTDCSTRLFLDVYATNDRAISLYERNGFRHVATRHDTDEGGAEYLILARSVAVA